LAESPFRLSASEKHLARIANLYSSPDQAGRASKTLIDALRTLAQRWSREEDGQGLAEYALILALIAIVAILSMIFLGDVIADLMDTIGSTIDNAT
jgi:pilus assembly protein Flp/PilA